MCLYSKDKQRTSKIKGWKIRRYCFNWFQFGGWLLWHGDPAKSLEGFNEPSFILPYEVVVIRLSKASLECLKHAWIKSQAIGWSLMEKLTQGCCQYHGCIILIQRHGNTFISEAALTCGSRLSTSKPHVNATDLHLFIQEFNKHGILNLLDFTIFPPLLTELAINVYIGSSYGSESRATSLSGSNEVVWFIWSAHDLGCQTSFVSSGQKWQNCSFLVST